MVSRGDSLGKFCTKCKIWKIFDDFAIRKAKKDGRKSECKKCFNLYSKDYYTANPKKRQDKLNANKTMRWQNLEYWSAIGVANYWKNPEEKRVYRRIYTRTNRGKCNALVAKYKTSKMKRTPFWSDLKLIAAIYEKCPLGFEVDHIIPLQGKIISGLHVPENLQYLEKSLNRIKKNKFPFNFPK
jgi:hypothetical protein